MEVMDFPEDPADAGALPIPEIRSGQEACLQQQETDDGIGAYTRLAFAAWAAAFLILTIRMCHLIHRVTTFNCFITAGRSWRDGLPIYTCHSGMGFVYSPLWAACFAIYSCLPVRIGEIVWLLSNNRSSGGRWRRVRE